MNIRSVGPALYLASQAATQDGQLDFVCAREVDRPFLWSTPKRGWREKSTNFRCPFEGSRRLRIVWEGSTLHIDDEHWPRKKEKPKSPSEIEITLKPFALVILPPAARERLNVSVSRLMGSKRE
jgi:hypothetical protein